MYNDVPTTCFGHFISGHHQVGIQCQRNYIPTINLVISVSVSMVRGRGACFRHLVQLGMTTWPQQQTIVPPGHPRTPTPQGPTPLGPTQLTNNRHTMTTQLIHVFPSPVYRHPPFFVKEVSSPPPPHFYVLTLTLMSIFTVDI